MTSFTDLSKTVIANWKSIDEETKDYCMTVGRILKERHTELSKVKQMGCLSTMDPVVPAKKKSKQRSADNNRMNSSGSSKSKMISCLPRDQANAFSALPFILEQAHVMRRRELQSMIPRRARSIDSRDQRAEGIVCLSTVDSISPGPKKESKQKSADNNRMNDSESTESGAICCLPTDQAIEFPPLPFSLEQAHDMRRRELQSMIPRRARSIALGDQQANHYPGMWVPTIDPVAPELMRMYHQQYLRNQLIAESTLTAMWGVGDGNLNTSNAEMPRLISSVCIQQGIQGAHVPTMKESYCDNELEFPIISNISRRAMISNMMSAIHTSQQPIAHREGIRSFGEHRRSSAPERLQTSKQEQRLEAMYEARELDISDSDVHDMWLSSKVDEGL